MPGFSSYQLLPAPPSAKTSRISRSSSGPGVPSSSWFEVLAQNEPSGAATSARTRPYCPTSSACGLPSTVPLPVTPASQIRLPTRQAVARLCSRVATPAHEDCADGQLSSGFVYLGLVDGPSAAGHP